MTKADEASRPRQTQPRLCWLTGPPVVVEDPVVETLGVQGVELGVGWKSRATIVDHLR